MNIILKNINVYDKHCNGCVETEKDIMISYQEEGDESGKITDLFLTRQQARHLYADLGQKIIVNQHSRVA